MEPKQAKIIDLPKFFDERGNLTVIENAREIPFTIRRAYWVYDVPGGEHRGGHAYRNNQELIVALSGSFDIIIDNGVERQVFPMNRSYFGLYVPSGLWREMANFSTNSLALILSSTAYDEADYLYDYDEFLAFSQHERK
ncbi:MAG: WxcM-like domain-containing protein [Alloprevotella sp.]|nr:WxcM-like domain-containing protein [Alloprevotella sp.]